MKIQWFGHDSFKIETQRRIIYIDPFVLPRNSELADVILITHDHFDHCAPEKVGEIRKSDTIIVTTAKAAEKLQGNVKTLSEGESMELEELKIEAVPAYNINKPFHPRGTGIGFVVTIDNKRIYHAGDTDFIPEMKDLKNIDVALLPISGTYVMDIDDAVKAVEAIRPKTVMPMHYNYLEGLERDPIEFKRKVEDQTETKVETGNVLEIQDEK